MVGRWNNKSEQWLDRLPLELCGCIASHVTGGQVTENGLHLARVSPCQRDAVLSSITIDFRDISRDWVDIFLSDRKAFEAFNGGFEFSQPNQPYHLNMFKTQSLRRVSISDDPGLFIAASKSTSIHEIDIELTDQIPRNVVFDLLSALKLTTLTLRCRAWWEQDSVCIFQDPKYFNENRNALADSCPLLESIQVDCLCREDDPPFWSIFPGLTSLREVGFRSPTAEVVEMLRDIESVKLFDLIDGHEAYQDAMKVGPAVTELRSYGRLHEEEIVELERCPRLSVLHCTIAEGSENSLIDVAPSLPLLQELQLHWHTPWEIDMDDDLPSYEIAPGALPHLVKALPSLIELRLSHIKVPLSEVLEIQKAFGRRLQVLEVHITSGKEEPLQCLEQVLYTASESNPSLRGLWILGAGLSENYEGSDSEYGEHARKALVALQRLQRKAPSFMWLSFEKTLEHIVEACN